MEPPRRSPSCSQSHRTSSGLPATREITDAIFYVLRSGCAWRLLPHEFPPWKTVYHYFRAWRLSGLWERMHSALRKRVRIRLKRDPQPSAAIADSHSIKTTGAWAAKSAALSRGQEGQRNKASSARGHAEGLVLMAKVHNASVTDRDYEHRAPARTREDRLPHAPLPSMAGRLSIPAKRIGARAGCRRFRAGPHRSLGTPRCRPPRR
jgi:transposase